MFTNILTKDNQHGMTENTKFSFGKTLLRRPHLQNSNKYLQNTTVVEKSHRENYKIMLIIPEVTSEMILEIFCEKLHLGGWWWIMKIMKFITKQKYLHSSNINSDEKKGFEFWQMALDFGRGGIFRDKKSIELIIWKFLF